MQPACIFVQPSVFQGQSLHTAPLVLINVLSRYRTLPAAFGDAQSKPSVRIMKPRYVDVPVKGNVSFNCLKKVKASYPHRMHTYAEEVINNHAGELNK